MNIGPETFEKAIAASCIQLAQAYSLTKKITIDAAKGEVAKYLQSLKDFTPPEIWNDGDHERDFKVLVSQAIKNADGKPEKAYLELLKLREIFN